MKSNLIKTLFLFIITLITTGLLVFCLVSNWWIKINDANLENIQKKYQQEYSLFSENVGPIEKTTLHLKERKNFENQVPKSPTVTVPSVKITTTSTTSTTVSFDKTTGDDYDYGNYDEYDSFAEEKQKKKFKRSESQAIDYVYIIKLWPLIKFKSLYSECLEYKEFPMKVSTAYLVQSKKEPLFGSINYGKQLNEIIITQQSKSTADECGPGKIRCFLSQECVDGNYCDGKMDCSDQSDEQQCRSPIMCSKNNLRCDNKCWPLWYECDKQPQCSDLTDEISCKSNHGNSMVEIFSRMLSTDNSTEADDLSISPAKQRPLTFGKYHFDKDHNCFVNYFNFNGAKDVDKDSFQYLSQMLVDSIQLSNNNNYYMQLIYSLSFGAALIFNIMALFSLIFVMCLNKICFQCPFWFYGFFSILAWISSSIGLLTFLYQCFSNKQHQLDPFARLPSENELLRLNQDLLTLQDFGISFWFAVAATSMSFFGSFVSCIVCCRLPSARHEDKEYKIMQLPTYT